MILTHRQIRSGERIPGFEWAWGWPPRFQWAWGFAWHEPEMRRLVLLPLPLNWLIPSLRRVYFALLQGPRDRYYEKIRQECESEYSSGFGLGYKDGERAAWENVERRVKITQDALGSKE